MARNKMGRPRTNLIYDAYDNLIDGLSLDRSTQTYIARFKDDKGKTIKKTFGVDKQDAIAKFRQWQEQQQGGKLLQVIQSPKPKIHRIKALEQQWAERFGGDGSAYVEAIKFVSEELIWDRARQLIQDNPVLASQKLKIPALANVEHLKSMRKPYTLTEIGDNYFDKVEFANIKGETKHEIDKVKKSWNRFVKAVDATYVTELAKDKIKLYYSDVKNEYITKKHSTTWIKGYFERVKRVINAAVNDLDYPSDINEALLRIKAVLKIPRSEIKIPARKISKEQFHLLLSKSNIEEKCMWLLSMNLGYYTVDIASLPLTAIDLKEKTAIFRRGKTGIHRSGILWDETIEAIRAYQKEIPHRGKTLFFNMQDKMPYIGNRIRKKFVKVRDICGLTITHNNFRDSFESICSAKNVSQRAIDAVMGHKIMGDNYTDPESCPDITAPACQAVWGYYFEDKTLDDVKS